MSDARECAHSFSAEERMLAECLFDSDWENKAETEEEYILRKREIDLSVLVDKIICDDLNDMQRKVLKKVAFEKKKPQTVAEELSVNTITVYRNYNKALQIIEKMLKYAVMYQRDSLHVKIMPMELKKIFSLAANRNLAANSIANRIRRLLAKENISIKKLCLLTDTDNTRIEKIVEGKEIPNTGEVMKLADLFGTTTDYILRGN